VSEFATSFFAPHFDYLSSLSVSCSLSSSRVSLSLTTKNLLNSSDLIYTAKILPCLNLCKSKLDFKTLFSASQAHGAAYLAGAVLNSFFSFCSSRGCNGDYVNDDGDDCKVAGQVLHLLGSGLIHSDIVTGLACAKALECAFDLGTGGSAAASSGEIKNACDKVLVNLEEGIGKVSGGIHIPPQRLMNKTNQNILQFGHGDHHDATRVIGLITAAGYTLNFAACAVGTTAASTTKCVDSLFKILGSDAYKKENEVAIKVGEALALYSLTAAAAAAADVDDDEDFDYEKVSSTGDLATMPPHLYVIFRLLRRELLSNLPQTRTATVSAMFVVVAKATELAALEGPVDGSKEKKEGGKFVGAVLHFLSELQVRERGPNP